MNKKFCMQTLTHSSNMRGEYLKQTVFSFLNNTEIPSTICNTNGKLDWFIRVNGMDDEMNESLNYLIYNYSNVVNFSIHIGDNIGVGVGINFLNNLSKDYEYVLLLEGDWICDGEDNTNVGRNWLDSSIKLLDSNPNMHQVFLRRYTSDLEDRQHGMSEWIHSENILDEIILDDITFIHLKHHCYTNNPTIRRLKTYFDLQIFPLTEYYDTKGTPTETKDHEDWGKAELEAYYKPSHLGTYWLWFGKFVHIDHLNSLWGFRGCNRCKYGFYSTYESFCLSCTMNEKYESLPIHSQRMINLVLPITDNINLYPNASSDIKSVVDNPTIDIEFLINNLKNKL
jgi:hypothetical protein